MRGCMKERLGRGKAAARAMPFHYSPADAAPSLRILQSASQIFRQKAMPMAITFLIRRELMNLSAYFRSSICLSAALTASSRASLVPENLSSTTTAMSPS